MVHTMYANLSRLRRYSFTKTRCQAIRARLNQLNRSSSVADRFRAEPPRVRSDGRASPAPCPVWPSQANAHYFTPAPARTAQRSPFFISSAPPSPVCAPQQQSSSPPSFAGRQLAPPRHPTTATPPPAPHQPTVFSRAAGKAW